VPVSRRPLPGASGRSSIKELVFTDTIEYRFETLPPCCKVISVASLFADAIISIHRRESVSRLFNY
jgi:ribose-phosphate pyrophosphokinase